MSNTSVSARRIKKPLLHEPYKWTALNFGKHRGISLPLLLFRDAAYFFWAFENSCFKGSLAFEAEDIDQKIRNIGIPNSFGSGAVVEYIVHPHSRTFVKFEIVHHATGVPAAQFSQTNGEMIVRDGHRMADDVQERFAVSELPVMFRKAADLFVSDTLSIGEGNDRETTVSDRPDLTPGDNRSPGPSVRLVHQQTISRRLDIWPNLLGPLVPLDTGFPNSPPPDLEDPCSAGQAQGSPGGRGFAARC